jgi:3-deoxy-manno-octulosonate cytidylyltransferase (CMP-KDO synthetase)
MKAVGVIPARWGSTRFPGKILTPVLGRPLLHWVVRNAARSRALSSVIVATDDERIRQAALREGVEAVMTRGDHPSGTDRVAEALRGVEAPLVVNVQGDEPLLDPALIGRLVELLREGWDMSTAAAPIRDQGQLTNPGVVKVVWDARGGALYFSRSVVPFVRDRDLPPDCGAHWRHLGIYGYRREFLERLVATPPCLLERAEKLEQLRALFIGGRIAVAQTEEEGIGVDTPADVPYVEQLLAAREHGADS